MEFRLLGPLEISEQGRPLLVGGPRARALLAILLLHRGEVVSTDRLQAGLWGEHPPPTGVKSIQVHVSRLRHELGADRLAYRAPGYVLHVDPDELDLTRFEGLVAEARDAPPQDAARLLREALGLWRGEPLADLANEPFAQAHLRRLEELRLDALEARIDADLACGEHRGVARELKALVVEHPLREGPRRCLMLALYRSGRQSEALDAYRDARRALVEELGLEPSPRLRDLEQAILRHDPALDLATADAAHFLLVHCRDRAALELLLGLAEAVARGSPGHGLVLTATAPAAELGARAAALADRAAELRARGLPAHSAVFTASSSGSDLARLAEGHDVDVVLSDAGVDPVGDSEAVLREVDCDVALLVRAGGPVRAGPVLVPFGAADHDWAALELAVAVARGTASPLRLLGAVADGRDASRLLADASLIVQRQAGIAAEPLLAPPGRDGLVGVAAEAGVVVVGLSDRWTREGLGRTRTALLAASPAPTVLVRRGRGTRGIEPRRPRTRVGWSLTGGLR